MMSLCLSLLVTCAFAEDDPRTCVQDSDCSYSCCNVDKQFVETGTCKEIEDFPRCKDRKETYNIVLAVYMVLFVVFLAICGL